MDASCRDDKNRENGYLARIGHSTGTDKEVKPNQSYAKGIYADGQQYPAKELKLN